VTAAQQVLRAQKPSELVVLLKTWTSLLQQLGNREQLLVPGGWRGSSTNWVVFLIERTGEDHFSFSVCNRGPTAAQYHPSKFVADGLYGQKLKLLATLTLTEVPLVRLCDPGFWALAFGQWVPNATEYHRAEVLYDVLLPWLAGVSTGRLTEHLADRNVAWRTPCRSNTSCMKNLLEALRLVVCAIASPSSWRPLLRALRREALLLAAEELTMRSSNASPQVQAALSLLAAYGAAPPKLRQDQLPKAVPQTCQVIALFFSIPGQMTDEVHRRLSELVTAVWDKHGGGSLLVCECPLGAAGHREWPCVTNATALAKAYNLEESPSEPCVLLFRADGQLQSKDGLRIILKDPEGRHFPWNPPGLDLTGQQLLMLGARSLARRHSEAQEMGRLAKAVHVLVTAATPPERTLRSPWSLPVNGNFSDLLRGELLRINEVEQFAGAVDDLRSTGYGKSWMISSFKTGGQLGTSGYPLGKLF